MKNKPERLADKTRKELHKCFEQFGLKITAKANLHVVNFLDVTFHLNNGKFKPYRKPNDDPLYINRHSNNFLCLIDKHFSPNHKLHKIFNRSTVKVGYNCMNNVKSIISKHNIRIIRKSKPQCEVIDPCTCRDKKTSPLQEKCMAKDIVYKFTVTTSNTNSTKHYIGMTTSTFKERYRNHIKSFNHKRYSNDTELSKYIWKLKDNKQDFDITWSVLKQSISYTGGSKRCNLCLEEKLGILKNKNNQNLLNKISEIVSTCNHRKKTPNKQSKEWNGRNACIV